MPDHFGIFGGGARLADAACEAAAVANGWRLCVDEPTVRWFARGRFPITQLPHRRGWIGGNIFAADGRPASMGLRIAVRDPLIAVDRICEALSLEFWGRYVAVLVGPDGQLEAVFRDPSGMAEANLWRLGEAIVVGSCLPPWADRWAPAGLEPDWSEVGSMLAGRDTARAAPLRNIQAVPAGAYVRSGRGDAVSVWRADQFIHAAQDDLHASALRLRETVDRCIASWASTSSRSMTELSGGFDSTIVAGSLKDGGCDLAAAINFFTDGVAGDERQHAKAATDLLKLPLVHAPRSAFQLNEIPTAAVCGLRPDISAVDRAYGDWVTGHASLIGVDTMFTGQGGDTVFHHPATPWVVADERRRRGLAAFDARFLEQTALRNGCSVWTLMGVVLQDLLGRGEAVSEPKPEFVAFTRPERTRSSTAPPAKRRQIEMLRLSHNYFTAGRRFAALDVIHPLLSQPIVELSIALPVATLTVGGRDRGLARIAFADRLPEAIARRRSKGTSSAYFAKTVVASLPFLRPHLLEGVLLREGLLDRTTLEAALEPSQMMRTGGHMEVLHAAVIEGWARHWSQRARTLRPDR